MKTNELPFIHLIKTPMNNYAYDVNTNAFVKLSEETYVYLEEMQDKDDPNLPAPAGVEASLNHLKSQGFFSSKRPKKIEHNQCHVLEDRLSENVQAMTLQVTQDCNFRCTYCTYRASDFQYQREHAAKRMPLETAIKAIDFLAKHSGNQKGVNIGFYGGEPLLEFEMMKALIEYAEDQFLGKELTFNLTTNASLLTLEVAKFFLEHNVSISVSLDGTSKIHDRSRKFAATGEGTFDVVMKNLKDIKEALPQYWNERVSLIVVVDPRYPCDELHAYFGKDSFFEGVSISSMLIDDTFSVEKHLPSKAYMRTNDQHLFRAYLSILGKYPSDKVSKIAEQNFFFGLNSNDINRKMTVSVSEVMAPGGPCIPGEQRLFVNVDGLLYPCERLNENSEAMIIGNLDDWFDIEKAKDILNVGALTEEDCKNCWAIRRCIVCAPLCDNNGVLCPELKRSLCDDIRRSVEHSLKDQLMLVDFGIPIDAIQEERVV